MAAVMETPIDLIGSSTFGIYPKISDAQTWNMFISDGWYVHYPGWKKIVALDSSIGGAKGRGGLKSTRGNIIIVCVGNSLWQFNSDGSEILLAEISTFDGPVFMAENLNSQICIVDGVYMYIYNRDFNTLNIQTVPDALTPNFVDYHNTGFLVGNGNKTGNGAEWFVFGYQDPQHVTVTYTLALETKSDYALAVVRLPGKGNNVLVLGESVGEIHTNVGGLLGYQRVSTMNIDYGTLSVATIARLKNYVFWLAINEASVPVILMYNGAELKEVSTDGINNVLENLNVPASSVGYLYSIGNHLFYVITFFDPTDNVTFAYDVGADKFYNLSDWNMDIHPARQVFYLNNNTYFISLKNGDMYQTGLNFLSQDENIALPSSANYIFADNHVIPQIRICSTFRKKAALKGSGRRFTFTVEQGNDPLYSEIYFPQNIVTQITQEDMITQTGDFIVTQSEFGSTFSYAPKISMAISKNGGISYGPEVPREVNFYGDRWNFVNWDQLGMFNEITFKVRFWGFSHFTCTGGTVYYS